MYASPTYYDDLMLAAAWLAKATQQTGYLVQAQQYYNTIVADPTAYQQPVYNWDAQFYAGCLSLWTQTGNRTYATQASRLAETMACLSSSMQQGYATGACAQLKTVKWRMQKDTPCACTAH